MVALLICVKMGKFAILKSPFKLVFKYRRVKFMILIIVLKVQNSIKFEKHKIAVN
jgi:hypothetical protein